MNNLKSQFPMYSRLLRLYPTAYRRRYEQEMLQITADMLSEAPTRFERIGVWVHIAADLPVNVARQQLSYAGGVMQHDMPRYVKRNGPIAGVMLLPFCAALLANGLDKLVNNHGLYNSWLWHSPFIGIWVLYLPTAALLVAGGSFLVYVLQNPSRQRSLIRRVFDLVHSWPIVLSGLFALGVLFIIAFHDSVHCWVQSPTHLASHLTQTWQCSEGNRASLPTVFERAFKL